LRDRPFSVSGTMGFLGPRWRDWSRDVERQEKRAPVPSQALS
jgi:hypothetical protein